VAVSPDGSLVATGSQAWDNLKVWDAGTGKLLREFSTGKYWTIPSFSPDGRWLMNRDGQCWRVEDWSPGAHHPGERGVAFSPDMSVAAWGGHKGYIPLADPATGRELARLEDPYQDTLTELIFSPGGTQLLGVSNHSFSVRVWDLRKLRLGLAELGLDWDTPPYPHPPVDLPDGEPLQIELIGAEALVRPAAK
jgi:WD40 repeat protein